MRVRERAARRVGVDRPALLTGILVFLSTSVFFTIIHYEDSWISHIHLEVRGHIPRVHFESVNSDSNSERQSSSPELAQARGGRSGIPNAVEDLAVAGDAPLEAFGAAGEETKSQKRLVGPDVLGDIAVGKSIFVTFATGTMSDFAFNW